jgi:hypothetical protein
MTAGAERGLVGEGNGGGAERNHSDYENQYDRAARLPAHALIEHVGGTVS